MKCRQDLHLGNFATEWDEYPGLTSPRPWPSHKYTAHWPRRGAGRFAGGFSSRCSDGRYQPRALVSSKQAAPHPVKQEETEDPGTASPDAERIDGETDAGIIPSAVAAVHRSGSDAWPQFLREYSPFMLTCIRRYASDEDERMDIYVHVCDRLAADDCRRIRQFRGYGRRGACRFTTWLAAVIFNLAREWIRTARGRRRLFQSIKDLGRTNRLVFKYYFWEGYSVGEIATLLQTSGSKSCDRRDVSERLASIERHLSRDHRWRLVTALLRSAAPVPVDGAHSVVGDRPVLDLPDDREDNASKLERTQARQVLKTLLSELPNEERLALVLRFERGMTAKEVAVALGIQNYKRIYDIQGRALAKLAEGLRAEGIELSDFLDDRTNSVRGSG